MSELNKLMKCELRYDVRSGWFDINHPEKGWSHIADIRGWGFLTGRGSGALGLDSSEGKMIQDVIAAEIVKLWNSRLEGAHP